MAATLRPAPRHEPALDISYLSLRKSIGWIGILMPWVVRAVGAFFGAKALMSISAYYHTHGRDIFVGSLFGVGLFLSFYKGSSRQDRILAVIWGLAAIFIGLIPMNPCNDPDLQNLCVDPGHTTYHFVPVAIFFAINIYMALFRFTKPSRLPVTPKKLQRNRVYVVSGIVMIVSALAIAYFDYRKISIFIPEAVAIAAFGVAWLVKGQMVLADE
jgi:hypothetical protein